MVDFLPLAIGYTVIFILISYVVLVGGSSFHEGGIISWFRRVLIKINDVFISVCERILPRLLLRTIDAVINYIFFTRNRCMLILYVFLIVAGSAVYTLRVSSFFGNTNIFFLSTYVLISFDVVLFTICNRKDPGVITSVNVGNYLERYEYDGVYYIQSSCRTCGTQKPARSKHCSMCNVCVSRFDHHCSWVNNCIGQHNYKYFLAFILTTAILCTYVTFITGIVFVYIIISEGLATMQYIGSNGNSYPMTTRHLCQYLLVHHPDVFTLFMVVLILSVFLFSFSCFHFYLTLTNQTTNELYKRCRFTSKPSKNTTSRIGKIIKRNIQDNKSERKKQPTSKTPYHISLWSNISDIMMS